ncbi:MAG: FHA domain-containing protein [Lentimicrobiaceae bacterium]|nr:FHA domain-containing protein [Lentimicrobiaceae bacterium]
MEIIIGRKGTQRTPITDTTVSREHCKLTINADGTYTLENLSINGTFVNGNSIIRTVVTPDTILRLGANFSVAVRDLLPLQAANIKLRQAQQQNPLQQFAKPAVDPNQERYEMEFRKLKSVYEKYTADKLAIQKEAGMTNFYRMLPMTLMAIVSLGAACIPGLGALSPVIAVVGLGLLVFSLFKSYNGNRDNPEKLEALNKQFMIDYVCPKCGNFLGFIPYENLENKSTCNFCKCKWV